MDGSSAPANYTGRFSMSDLGRYIISFWEFKDLFKLSGLSKDFRRIVSEVLFDRVIRTLQPFLFEDDVLPFFEMLRSVNGVVFGHAAQQVACPGRGEVMDPGQCLTHEDLNIFVPGPDGLEEVMCWLLDKGYAHWRVADAPSGRVGPSTTFAVGVRSSNELSQNAHSITIAFGSTGALLSTLPVPLGDAIGVLGPSYVYLMEADAYLRMEFNRNWAKLIAPWSLGDLSTPEPILVLLCTSVARHNRVRECWNWWCPDVSVKFNRLKRIPHIRR